MTGDRDIELRAFVEAWQVAAARLEDLRREGLCNVEVADEVADHIKA